jgi:O-antigen/teichoic acid export membrane protein
VSTLDQPLAAQRAAGSRAWSAQVRLPHLRSGGVVLAATLVWHASNFGFNSVSARLLGPSGYSELAATVALLYVASPVLVSIQTLTSRAATALTVTGDEEAVRPMVRASTRRLALVAVLIAAAATAVSPLVGDLLRLPSGVPVAIVIGGLSLSLLTHCQRGALQGTGRFSRYAASTAVEGVAKVVGAAAILLLAARSVNAAAAAIPLAAACTLVVNRTLLSALPAAGDRGEAAASPVERGSVATLATFILLALLLSADVFAARRFLPGHEAGLYAAVSLCGKVAYFATSAIPVFLFPSFSAKRDRKSSARWLLAAGIAIVVAVSAAIAVGYTVAPKLVLDPLFGARYTGAAVFLGQIAIAFGAYAVTYLSATYLVACRSRAGAVILAVAAAAQVSALLIAHSSVASIVHDQMVVLGTAAVATSLAAFRIGRDT